MAGAGGAGCRTRDATALGDFEGLHIKLHQHHHGAGLAAGGAHRARGGHGLRQGWGQQRGGVAADWRKLLQGSGSLVAGAVALSRVQGHPLPRCRDDRFRDRADYRSPSRTRLPVIVPLAGWMRQAFWTPVAARAPEMTDRAWVGPLLAM